MKKSCGLSVGIPNIVILDTEGKMRDTRSGHVDEREFGELTAAINLLRAKVSLATAQSVAVHFRQKNNSSV